MQKLRNMIRIAGRIQEALSSLQKQKYFEFYNRLSQYNEALKEITTESNLIAKALLKQWFASAEICTNRIDRLLNDLTYSIQNIKNLTEKEDITVPTLRILLDELIQLKGEFAKIEFKDDEDVISVITEAIVLEGVYLGPFEIELYIDKLSELYKDIPYSVIALDPNPAAASEDVTHPHVSNEKLCEGDGHTAIRTALEQGRLTDFFTMVKSILQTYNPESPYVHIYDWEGTACYDCGCIVNSEDCYYCSHCERDFCSECTTCCNNCDETICIECAVRCVVCDVPVCPSCIQECDNCGRHICKGCITDGLCPDCEPLLKDDEDEEQCEEDNPKSSEAENHNTTSISANPQVLPDSVGEIIILQRQNKQ